MRENKETYPEQQQFSGKKNKEGITPIILAVLSVILLLVCYTWILQNSYSRNRLDTAVERNIIRMDSIIDSLSGVLSDEDFASIQTIEDMDTEVYIRLQNELDQMRKLKSVRYLYTAGRNADGTLVYLVDGLDLDAEDFAYPGTAIEEEMIPYLEDALSGKVSYSQSIMDTTWGHIISACYPVYSKQNPGEIIGALCMEIDMESTYEEIERSNQNAARTAVIAIIIASLLTVLAYVRRNATPSAKIRLLTPVPFPTRESE